jgi:hypothetical protein
MHLPTDRLVLRLRRGLSPRIAALLVLLVPAVAARAERPSAMKLFPEESLVFVRVANANDLGQKLRQTSTGRMLRDPQLAPFVEALYGKAGELFAEHAQGPLGLSWDDVKSLPKGEVALAVVAREGRRPALVLMIDQGDEASVADKLLDRALDISQQQGAQFSTEKIGDVEVTIIRDKDRENRMFGVFERENTIVVATDSNVLRNILWHWDHPLGSPAAASPAVEATAANAGSGDADAAASDEETKKEAAEFVPGRTLAENDRFVTIVKQCRRPQDPPPQLVLSVDPIGLVRNAGRGSGGTQLLLGLLPSLGLDGLMAIGGTSTIATDEFDQLFQMHVMLENPRSGVMLLPAFQAGETAPQQFVPANVASYITWNLNLRTTYDRVVALVDQFRYQGSVDKFVKENMSDKIGIDVPTQVVDNLKGRYTWITGFDRPSRVQGDQHLFAFELADENAANESLKTVMQKFPELFEERSFGNVKYHAMKNPRPDDVAEEERPFHPCVGIMEGYVFISTSCQRFEDCVAARDGTVARLADSSDFARASALIGRETVGITPVLFSVSRSEESLRHWYEVLLSENTRTAIDENKEGNPVLEALAEVMDEHKLPPFEVLARYLGPSGGILYDTDSGYHAISFELRTEVTPEDATNAEPSASK